VAGVKGSCEERGRGGHGNEVGRGKKGLKGELLDPMTEQKWGKMAREVEFDS
jgi:hypothetical protein